MREDEQKRLQQRNQELEALVIELRSQLMERSMQSTPSKAPQTVPPKMSAPSLSGTECEFELASTPLSDESDCEENLAREDYASSAQRIELEQKINQLQAEVQRHQRAQEWLRMNEARYRSLVDAMHEGILLLNAEGTIETCNTSAEEILGCAAAALISCNVLELDWQIVHEDGSPSEPEDFPGIITAKTGISCSEVVLGICKAERDITWISINSQPLFQADEILPYAVVVSFSDVTPRKRIEAERNQLLQREQAARAEAELARNQISQVLQSITDGFVAFDRDSRFTYVNHEAARTIGRSSRDLLGKVLWREFPEFGETCFGRLYRRAVAEGVPLELVDYYAPCDRWFSVRAYPSKSGVSLYFRNVTDAVQTVRERDQAEEELRDSEARFRQLAENIQQIFWMYDVEQQKLIYMSPVCQQVIGYTAQSCYDKTPAFWLGHVRSEELPRVMRASRQALRGKPVEVMFRFTKTDGRDRWLLARAFPIRNAHGRVYRIAGIAEDISDRKAQEQRLRLLESVVVNANDAVIITEAEPVEQPGPKIIYVNDAFTRMMGYERDEVIGKTPRILQGEKTDLTVLNNIRSALKNWEPAIAELVNYHKDGSEVWIELSIFPVSDETGHYTYWVGLQRDITHRKRTEEAIQRQNWRSQLFADITLKIRQSLQLEEILQTTVTEVRNLLKADRVLIYRLQPDETGVVCNEAVRNDWNSLLGKTYISEVFLTNAEQSYCKSIDAIEDIEHTETIQSRLAFLRSISVRAELVVPIVQQQTLWGLLIVHQCDQPRQWSAFEVDLLQQLANQVEIALTQSQLLQALRESEERFRTMANSAPVLLWMMNPNGEFVFCNQSLLNFIGSEAERDELIWQERMHGHDLPQCRETYKQAIATRTSFEIEYRLRRFDGDYRWVLDRGVPRFMPDGSYGGHIGSCIDITERKRVEDERKQAEIEMQKALSKERELSELKSNFVTTVSHEFRTPLSTILSSADMLEFYGGNCSVEKQLEHVQRIQTAALNMKDLLNDVLLLERAKAKRVQFEPVEIDLIQFCADITDEMQLNDRHQHPIVFESRSQLTEIAACMDVKALRQIFTNLLSNALKYSPAGSTVYFRIDRDEDFAYLEVEDQGIGIPASDQARLFEAFHRGANVGAISGNGLGLAIVKQSIQVQGGQIRIVSQENLGTIVRVILPLVPSIRSIV